MTKKPYMPFFPDAYLSDTTCLTMEEQGAYFRLLCWMWINGGKLENNDQKIAKILNIHPNKWQKLRASVTAYFTPCPPGHLTQYRLQKEYQRAHKSAAGAGDNTPGMESANALENQKGDGSGGDKNFLPTSPTMDADSGAAPISPNPSPIANRINQEEMEQAESCGKLLEPLLSSERAIAFTNELARQFDYYDLTMPSDHSVLAGWLRKGADPDKDILPIVDNILNEIVRKHYFMPQSWKYFGKAVFASVRKRKY